MGESSGTFEPQTGFGTIQAKPKPKPASQDQFQFKSPSKLDSSSISETSHFKVPTFKGSKSNQDSAESSSTHDEVNKNSTVTAEDISATIRPQLSSTKISSESSSESSPITSNPEITEPVSLESSKHPDSEATTAQPISQQHEIESDSSKSSRAAHAAADESEDEDEEEGDETDDARAIPSSHECSLPHGTKPITALALDPAGARLASGGHDFELKVWDFSGMTAAIRPFRTLTPFEKCAQLDANLLYMRILLFFLSDC